jgi:hypothetical protein
MAFKKGNVPWNFGYKYPNDAKTKMSRRQRGKKNPHFPVGYTSEENGAREKARQKGERYYRSLRPCKQGHISKRFVLSLGCAKCHSILTVAKSRLLRNTEPWFASYCATRNRARRDGIKFTLTPSTAKTLYPIDRRCPVLGIELMRTGKIGPQSPTIDRFKPSEGYILSNVTIMSYKANLIKTNETNPEIFERMAGWLKDRLTRVPTTGNPTVPVEWCRQMMYGARKRAKQENLSCTLTVADIQAAWPQNNLCPIYRVALQRSKKQGIPMSASLDKIIPSLGYVPGNIAVMSFLANRIKQDETDPETFLKVASWIRRKHETR